MTDQDPQETQKPNGGGVQRIFKAMNCSFKGFSAACKHESAFRQELLLCAVLFPFSFVLASSITHWALLITMLLVVLTVELLNSAIEAITDRVGTDYHVLSGRAKDTASAAVFLALTMMFITWGAALLEKVM
jgi:diacylglycerol kinase (ATP)